MKTPKKKREATPKASKVSRASVDAPPAPSPERVAAWVAKASKGETKEQRDARMFAELSDKSGKPSSPPGKTGAEANPDIPEELQAVWDKDIAAAFQALRPQQQDFLLCYLREGNAAAAYRFAYNKLAKDHLASVCGSQHLATLGIQSILLKFASIKTEALFQVIHGYREMAQATKPEWVQDEDTKQWENVGDVPDWQARKEAFLGIRKIHGLDAAEKVDTTVKGSVVHVYGPEKKAEGHGG